MVKPNETTTPKNTDATKETAAPKKPDLSKDHIKKAIARGKEMIKSGSTKADVSREIYELVKEEDREVILEVFQQGAGLTEKGSLTYLYNIKRKSGKKS